MTAVCIGKCLMFSIISSWRSIHRHPFVAALLLFMLFLYVYLPSIFAFIVNSSPVIACTSLLLGALLVYGEPDIHEPENVKSLDVSVKVAEKEERSRDVDFLKKAERYISEENDKNRRPMSVAKDGPFKRIHDGEGKDGMDLVASSSSNIAEKEVQTEETVTKVVEARGLEFIELFSHENRADHEGLKVEIEKHLDNQFDSTLGSPWQQVDSNVSADSESDESDESGESDGEESSSPDTSLADIVPIIDELHPLLESEDPHPAYGSIDTSDTASRVSSPEHEFEDGSAEEEIENQADEEDEEAQEEKDNTEAVVKWTADDQKNLMDLGSSEIERNQRLENMIAKRRAKKLQKFQTDKNLIDLDTESLPFMEDISRVNVQVPAVSVPRSNPFDPLFDSVESLGLPPIPGSAPSVLLPRRNPFDLPYYENEESSSLTGENSRPYDASNSQRDTLPRTIDRLSLEAVSDDVSQEKNAPKLKPYFVPEKMSGTNFASFEGPLNEESDSEESLASESDSASAVFNQDHDLFKHEMHERVSSVSQDVYSVEQESDSSLEVCSANLEPENNGADAAEEVNGEVESNSPVSSTANLEVIDERYDGSNSSTCSEDDKGIETNIHIEVKEPISSSHTVGYLRSSSPMLSVDKPAVPGKGAEVTHYSHVAEPGLSGKGVEGADDSQIADPVYDSSPSAKSTYHIPSLETLFSEVKGKEGFSTGSSLASETQANLQEVLLTPMVFEQGTALEEEDFVRERKPPVPQDYIDGVGIDQENVVEKVIGLNELSDEVHANLREIESFHERSDSGINLTENLRMENLMPDGENQELQAKPVKQLDSKKVNSYTEKEDIQFQYPVLRSDDAGISVNQPSNLNNSLDQHSAMEQHLALKLNAGSSIIPLDGDIEIKNANLNLHIPQPSVLDTVLPGQQSSLETVASSISESTSDNSRNSPKSLNSKDKLEPSEYELNKNQSESA